MYKFPLVLSGPARTEYFLSYYYPPVGIGVFLQGMFLVKKVTAQIPLRLYIHEFLSEYFYTYNICNRHYELYISMANVMQIFIVRQIQPFKVKLKNLFNCFNKSRER